MIKLLGVFMTAKKKNQPKKECPKTKLTKAEEITKQYTELSKCCSVLASIREEADFRLSMYDGGWRLREAEITSAGIDIEEVYAHIQRLANKRRTELECELAKLE
jgi:hypothetical protein